MNSEFLKTIFIGAKQIRCAYYILLLSHKQLETIYVNFLHTLFMNIAVVMHML